MPHTDKLELRRGSITIPELRRQLAVWLTTRCDFYFVLAEPLRISSPKEFPRMLRLQESCGSPVLLLPL